MATTKYLSQEGVGTLWGKIKSLVSDSIAGLSSVYAQKSHTHTKSNITDLKNIDDATKNDGGLMSQTQADKLAGIAAGANKYTLPTAGKDQLGGVKTTSTVTSASGYTAAPIIGGVPYYKDTDTKVTQEAYHYAPSEDSGSELESGIYHSDGEQNVESVGAYAKDTEYAVVTGVKLQRDSKGHVVGIKTTKQKVKDTNTTYSAATTSANGLMSSADKTKLNGVATGAQANVIETVKVNGTALTPSSKAVNITVPTDNASLANGAGYQTEAEVNALIDAKLTTAIVPKGSTMAYMNGGDAGTLPTPAKSILGHMYNVTEAFGVKDGKLARLSSSGNITKVLTNAVAFKAPDGDYPAGSNIVCVEDGGVYKWDVMAGFVDLSGYVLSSDVVALTSTEIDEICK